jgi:hypothetical protein
MDADPKQVCKITVDGTNFWIYEPMPFDRKWYSHKINGPAVRYKVGICIKTGWIVWINGPFPAGKGLTLTSLVLGSFAFLTQESTMQQMVAIQMDIDLLVLPMD